ncbi:GumC family protein [Sphingomonas sp. 35-24ZXX]|uniref:GumC family protein n=1 Tax=Sphingomonas sp. 35-24ZXX TaxID=1545915 RepID=UPI0009DF3147|nr:polysaccharide biosynthesis tyrosine autokinase [Sphingomonas sp. 35-24ZXX]
MSKFNPNTDQSIEVARKDYSGTPSSALDLMEIYAAAYRSRFVLMGIFVGCLMLAAGATLLITRKYDGIATVEVRQEAEKVLGTEDDRESVSNRVDVERFLDTQVGLARSRVVLTAVADELGLFRENTFLEEMNVSEEPETGLVLSEQEARRKLVLETLDENLSVSFSGQTRLLKIVFRSPDSRLSAKVANSVAENYIRSNLQRKSESSSYALEFLQAQLREAQIRLEASQRAALEYGRRTRIVDVSSAASATNNEESTQPRSLITAQLVQLNSDYTQAVAERVAAEQKWIRTRSQPILNNPDVLANQAIQGLLEQRATLQSEYELQLETRQSDFPSVRQVSAKLQEIERQLTAVASNIRSGVQSQFEIAKARERQLLRQLEALKGETLVEQSQTIQLTILRREADTNRVQFESLLRRYNQLNAESGVQANNLAIVDQAVIDPEPVWPNIPLNIVLALMAAFGLSVIYMFVDSQLFDRIRTPADVKDKLNLPILGAIPITTEIMSEVSDQKSEISEAFNLIRTGISVSSVNGAPKSVMLTSVQASEGKTSSCVSIAIGFARLGKRVLLIDVDLRRPNIHRLLDLPNKVGMSSILSTQSAVDDAIQQCAYPGLDVITGGPVAPSPTDLLMGNQFKAMMDQMVGRYDIVLVDTPPLLSLADAEILSGQVEAIVFVLESGRNGRKSILNAISRIQKSEANFAGVVLTKYNPGEMGYGNYGEYAYVYRYADSTKD